MGELLAEWPSAGLTLFARYGVGGREKLGFRPEQRLRQVLSRYLVFDVEAVLQRLRETEWEQRRFRISPARFAELLAQLPLVDCRSPEEFRLGTLPGARLLDAALADWKQARFACEQVDQPLEGDPALAPFECLRLWRCRDYLAVLRSSSEDWPSLAPLVHAWDFENHPWRSQPRSDWTEQVRAVLAEEIQPDLQSHKGVVLLKEMRDGVAYVELGGGCQGCSSAAITVGQEIAAALWRRIPELEGVEDASSHEDPSAQPHH